ncbi:MAG TPA: urease accessory protein UreD [Methylophilaceae bacterium]|nr:urease accessory protein UreD [Methylophilaceae bacterium]
MDDAYSPQQLAIENPADGKLSQVARMAPWQASLALAFASKDDRTILVKKQHQGPLVIQKVLYPEGHAVCHCIIVHPPGGVAGGDALTLAVQLAEDANALLTTPGAAKWYKANGRKASQLLKFDLASGASLEWLPQENILFDGAMLDLSAEINLAQDATYAGWEILCFGRQASNEQWQVGQLKQKLVIRRDGKMIWQERAFLSPASKVMSAMAGLGGNVVSGSFVVAAGLLPDEVLAECREVTADDGAKVAVTALPEVFSARYIGQSSQSARHYFEALWHILRPWYAKRQVIRPRIWNT